MKVRSLPGRAPHLALATALFAVAHGAMAATAAGTSITNQATATYIDSALQSKTATSNTVVTVVQQVASLTMPAGSAKSAAAGTQVVYPHSVTNTGNGADTFSLSAANSGAFTMTNVVFYADANGDGVADNATPITSTGSLPAGGTFGFVAVGTLPGGIANGTTNAIVVTSTSAFTNTVKATSTDTTTTASAAQMDITANIAGTGAPGAGAGAEAAAVVNNTAVPGGTSRFTLVLNNAGGSPDTFNLQSSLSATFANQDLPSGWTVVFKDASGNVITNATVAAGGQKTVYADVTVPAGATLGTTDLYFRVTSPTSGVGDIIHQAVTVGAAPAPLTLTKTQSLDADCDGVADNNTYSNANITTGAVPGACIRYQITATNSSAADVNLVVIRDAIPANTTYFPTGPVATTLGAITTLLTGPVSQLEAGVGRLTPGQSATMSFGVRINQ
jgi:uncharacterized repeat protein (TIGR01451 family)